LLVNIKWIIFAHEFIHYDLEFDLNNPHMLIEEEVWKLMVLDISKDVEEATLVLIQLVTISFFWSKKNLGYYSKILETTRRRYFCDCIQILFSSQTNKYITCKYLSPNHVRCSFSSLLKLWHKWDKCTIFQIKLTSKELNSF
jgi:hypothetical protein